MDFFKKRDKHPDSNTDPTKEFCLNNTQKVDLEGAGNKTIRWLNLLQRFLGNQYEAVLLHPTVDQDITARMGTIEQAAYKASGYGSAAEGSAFINHYRDLNPEATSPILHLGLRRVTDRPTPEDLSFIMSLFQNFDHWIFDENREALNRHYQEHQTKDDPLYVGPRTPVLIISKIARDPSHREFLSAAENPHITMLALYLFNICKQSPYGVIVETRAQPDTQRLLQPRSVRRTFPGYHVIYPPNLYNEVGRLSENPTDPSIMLFHLPHTRNLDLIKGNIPSLVLGTGK